MKNILILGSLPKNENQKKLYEIIIDVSKKFVSNVNSPIDTVNFEGNEVERYERAFEMVKNADLIIGEQTNPSTGQGMEIRECALLGKPLIVVAKEGSKISGLVKGCPVTKEIIYYSSLESLSNCLSEKIPKYLNV